MLGNVLIAKNIQGWVWSLQGHAVTALVYENKSPLHPALFAHERL